MDSDIIYCLEDDNTKYIVKFVINYVFKDIIKVI